MVEADFVVKKDDTAPSIVTSLADDEGIDINITGATVRFHMVAYGSSTTKVDAAATIVNADRGVVQYTWGSSDTDTVGWYRGEFEVTYSSGEVEHFPNSRDLVIRVVDNIE